MSKNRFAPKFHIKSGDNVVVISGSWKGERGVVRTILTDKNKAVVEGVNIVKRHVKATQQAAGSIEEKEAPIHISNLMLVDPKTGTPTKVGRRVENGTIVRYAKKSGQTIQ